MSSVSLAGGLGVLGTHGLRSLRSLRHVCPRRGVGLRGVFPSFLLEQVNYE